MGVQESIMAVNMLMDQVNFEEQVEIVQNRTGGAFGNNGVAFSHNKGPVGNFFEDGEVMGSGDDGLTKGV